MRTLYESILDDEDVLVNDTNKSINDPFAVYIAAVDNNVKNIELQKLLEKGLFDKFIEEELYLNPEDYFWGLNTYTDNIASASLRNKDNTIIPFIIRYRRKTKQFDIEIYKFSRSGRVSDIFEYDKYKKTLSNFRKRGFKKSTWSLDKMGNYNVYNKKI
jgi:hypothetical protein